MHVIDLDGALEGKSVKKSLLKICKKKNLNIQVGGGIRSLEQISELIRYWCR